MAELPLSLASRRLAAGLKPGANESSFTILNIKNALSRRRASSQLRRTVRQQSEVDAARRNQVKGILDRSTGVLFDVESRECWFSPIVYAALKDGVPIYVGMSRHGVSRIGVKHHKAQAFLGAELMVWCVPTVQDAITLEQLLIEGLQPVLNEKGQGRAQRLAELTGMSLSRAHTLAKEMR